jgi:hypothetical protein
MATLQHHAVLATTWIDSRMEAIEKWVSELPHQWQRDLFTATQDLAEGMHRTMVLTPDGAVDDSVRSQEGDALRELFLARLKEDDPDDGASPWAIVEVSYGERGARIVTREER